jgi:peptidoglycan/xylan/chitin deacetylase (PgdA/CDA1 family)
VTKIRFSCVALFTARAALVRAVLLTVGAMWVLPAMAAESATVLLYHRFGEPNYAAANISAEDFTAHVRLLRDGGFSVLPLDEIVDALQAGRPLPDRTVAITIDDAFRSAYEIAWPILRAAEMPFGLFVSTRPIDQGLSDYMNWDEIRELAAAGVYIGHHGRDHAHMADLGPEAVRDDLAAASARFKAVLGEVPGLFAYPFGEANAALFSAVKEHGFVAALGQHSGVLHSSLDQFYLPRFPSTGSFAALERLQLVASALPLPVSDLKPSNPALADARIEFSFTVPAQSGAEVGLDFSGLEGLTCFVSGRGAVPLELANGPNGVAVRLAPLDNIRRGHTRINCTALADQGRFRWLGMQYYLARQVPD